jgi:hypothetical protein
MEKIMNRFDRIASKTILTIILFSAPVTTYAGFTAPDNGSGWADVPPIGSIYHAPDDTFQIIDGFPGGTQINIAGTFEEFNQFDEFPGGNLGGLAQNFNTNFIMPMSGIGDLAGYMRHIQMSLTAVSHAAPFLPGDPVLSYDTDMFSLQGDIFGDPDFDMLSFRAGTAFGLPSPGHNTLTRLGPPGSDFNVDSFFDIIYEIEFVGAPGSVLQGLAGTTQGVIRMEIPGDPIIPEPASLSLITLAFATLATRRPKRK